ncbi:HTH-type transcriptional regulator NmtR [bacterium HR18]|nr:HTH-type transcriptional regulator NmtR [bacterium HR18]
MLLEKASTAVALKAKLFRGFADPSRLVLLEVLRQGPQTVTALVEATGLTQPNVSNHLRCLLDCGLVHRYRQGRFIVYQLSDDRIAELLRLAEQVLAEVARGVYRCTRYSAP